MKINNINSVTFVKGVVIGEDEVLHDGIPQIAFVGRSNVGKSSLINALTGTKGLAKVGKKPGKTTEINFFIINNLINKKQYIVDLPGYGFAESSLAGREKLKKLIIWYLSASGARPEVVVLVLDVKAGLTRFDQDMILILKDQRHPYLIVVNKVDKLSQKDTAEQIRDIQAKAGDAKIVRCSSETGEGIDILRDALFS